MSSAKQEKKSGKRKAEIISLSRQLLDIRVRVFRGPFGGSSSGKKIFDIDESHPREKSE